MENDSHKNGNISSNLDLGRLLVSEDDIFRPNETEDIDDYIHQVTRSKVQIIVDAIFKQPTEMVDEVLVVKLPKPKTILPRMKPLPKPKPLTKWEKFAKEKGIQKTKKPKKTWDEQLKKFVPIYGFKKAESEKQKNWVMEVPANADPYEDQFAKKATAKSENVAKNQLQRLRNIARAKNIKIPRVGITTDHTNISSAKDLEAAVTVAKASTASLGKFQSKLSKEKTAKGVADITPGASRKRKLPPISGAEEKNENLQLVETVLRKRPKLDVERAAANQIQATRSATNDDSSKRNQKQKKNKSAKKPKSQKGKKKVGKKQAGRKRR